MKLDAKFEVATLATNFSFADAQQAARFAKAVQNYSNRMFIRLGGEGKVAIGSTVNAFPMKKDGSGYSDDGLTLGEFAGEIPDERAKKNKKPKAPKAPAGGPPAAPKPPTQ